MLIARALHEDNKVRQKFERKKCHFFNGLYFFVFRKKYIDFTRCHSCPFFNLKWTMKCIHDFHRVIRVQLTITTISAITLNESAAHSKMLLPKLSTKKKENHKQRHTHTLRARGTNKSTNKIPARFVYL